MGHSTLLGTGEQAAQTGKGHGTGALGASDSSDSGSDVRGGPGVVEDAELPLDRGASDDPGGGPNSSAGPDLGDRELDTDSDRNGTGERQSAGREDVDLESGDLFPDRVEAPAGEQDETPARSRIADEIERISDDGTDDSNGEGPTR